MFIDYKPQNIRFIWGKSKIAKQANVFSLFKLTESLITENESFALIQGKTTTTKIQNICK